MRNIIVCEPIKEAIKIANKDVDTFLFRETVNYNTALEQHRYLTSILNDKNINIIKLNELLPNYIDLKDVSNFLFTRDTFIKTKKGIIIGRMKENVRSQECELMIKIFTLLMQPIIYKMEAPEILEGGDYFYHNDISFIATGTRTNSLAAAKMLSYDLFGTDTVALIYSLKPDINMHRIHLDCYFSPFGERYCLLWEELIRVDTPYQRMVIEYKKDTNGNYKRVGEETTLFKYLINNHYNVIPISTESHLEYGCNILELEDGTVLAQDEESHRKIKNSILVPFNEIHKMYGGIHCATNII